MEALSSIEDRFLEELLKVKNARKCYNFFDKEEYSKLLDDVEKAAVLQASKTQYDYHRIS